MTPGPPWIVFDRQDGSADILPAMRQGAILEGVELGLAEVLVRAANAYNLDQYATMLQRTGQGLKGFLGGDEP